MEINNISRVNTWHKYCGYPYYNLIPRAEQNHSPFKLCSFLFATFFQPLSLPRNHKIVFFQISVLVLSRLIYYQGEQYGG